MVRKQTLPLVLLLGVALAACGDSGPPPQPAAPQVPEPPVRPAAQTAPEAATEPSAGALAATRRFRPPRDIFDSVVTQRQRPAGELTHPLQQFSIQQLRLLGIIWGIPSPAAIVLAPDNKEYILRVGTPVGTGDGKVVAVLEDRVVVVERYYDYRGQLQSERYEIVLPSKRE